MTNDTRTVDQIERDIAQERMRMSNSINELQDKFSVENIVRDVGDIFRGRDGDMGGALRRSVADTVGRNPAATALTAVGLAWMFLSATGSRDERTDRSGRNADAFMRNRADNRSVYRSDDPNSWSGAQNMADYRDRSDQERRGGIGGAMRSGAGAVSGSVSDAASGMRERAHDLRERLAHGTEDFSAEAKTRIIAARQAAYDAQVAAEDAMKRGGRAAADMFDDQPLVMGALAVALGAAVGSLLPHSRVEDDMMGESRDRLFAEAEAIYREERDKAMAVVRSASHEAKEVMKDASSDLSDMVPDPKTASDAIKTRVSEAGTRVRDEAQSEAEKQGLGSRKR